MASLEMTDGLRYLVAYSDGGAGMRHPDAPLEVGDELDDCGECDRVVRATVGRGPSTEG
jgi:hypothetical protein